MKNRTTFQTDLRHGFTLVEIVSVIAVLAVLFAVLAGSVLSINKKAKVTESKALFSRLEMAVQAYQHDYGYYPNLGGTILDGDQIVDLSNAEQWARFIKVFALESPTGESMDEDPLITQLNPRKNVYLNLQIRDLPADSLGVPRLEDAFGNPHIKLVMDADMDGRIAPANLPGGAGSIAKRVAVYTQSPNGEYPELTSWD